MATLGNLSVRVDVRKLNTILGAIRSLQDASEPSWDVDPEEWDDLWTGLGCAIRDAITVIDLKKR
ncbi:MAG: hypothetical protein ACE5HT_01635 [Gemmatimonadales bacterium]